MPPRRGRSSETRHGTELRRAAPKLAVLLACLCHWATQADAKGSETVLGIDLGSFTTRVSVVSQPGALPQIQPNAMGSRTIPTLVGFNSRGERLIGDRAVSASCSSCVFYGARDLLGEPLGALSAFWGTQMTPYNVTKDPRRPTTRVGAVHGKDFSPEEIMAMLLQEAAKQFTPGGQDAAKDLAGIVVSVPPFWTERRRQALVDAADIAGLKLLSVISDHAAAALQLGVEQPMQKGQKPRTVAVVGMGAGSVYAALVRFSTYVSQAKSGGAGRPPVAASVPQVQVKRLEWDSGIGGWHLDARLAEHLAEQFVEHQVDEGQRVSLRSVQGDPRAMVRLLAAARKAKEVLSTNTEARVQVNGLLPGHDFVAVVSRQEFEELVDALLDRAAAPLVRLLRNKPTVDAVEIVGGSVRVPALQRRLQEAVKAALGKDLHLGRHVNTDEAVALGAGLRAANLTATAKSGRLLPRIGLQESAPLAVKMSITGGEIQLIKAGELLPAKKAISVPDRVADFEVSLVGSSSGQRNTSSIPGRSTEQSLALFKVEGIPAALAKAKADAKSKSKSKSSSSKSKDKSKDKSANKEAKPVTSVDVLLEFSLSRSGLVGLDKAYTLVDKKKSQTLKIERSFKGFPRLSTEDRSLSKAVLKELEKADLKRSAAAEARSTLEGYIHMAQEDLENFELPESCRPHTGEEERCTGQDQCKWDEAEGETDAEEDADEQDESTAEDSSLEVVEVDKEEEEGDESEDSGDEKDEGDELEDFEGVEEITEASAPNCTLLQAARLRLVQEVAATEDWLREEVDGSPEASTSLGASRFRERAHRLSEARQAFLAVFDSPEEDDDEDEDGGADGDGATMPGSRQEKDGGSQGDLLGGDDSSSGSTTRQGLQRQVVKLERRVRELEVALESCQQGSNE